MDYVRFGDITGGAAGSAGLKVVRLASPEPKGVRLASAELKFLHSSATMGYKIVQRTARLDQGRGSARG